VKPIRTDFRGYEGKSVAADKRTGKVVIADEDPKVVIEKARKLEGMVVGGRVPYADEPSPVGLGRTAQLAWRSRPWHAGGQAARAARESLFRLSATQVSSGLGATLWGHDDAGESPSSA
jgi:hypothetical protein